VTGLGRKFVLAALLAVVSAGTFAASPTKKSPIWSELTAEQQLVLKPLAADWNGMEPAQRSRWVGLAKRYPEMQAAEQKRMQNRMEAWARLTPEQRREAREKYRRIGKLPPEKREVVTQQWNEYQQLPEHVRQGLAAESPKRASPLAETKSETRKRTRTAKQPPAQQLASPPTRQTDAD